MRPVAHRVILRAKVRHLRGESDRTAFMLFERWRDADEYTAVRDSRYRLAYVAERDPLLREPPEVVRWTLLHDERGGGARIGPGRTPSVRGAEAQPDVSIGRLDEVGQRSGVDRFAPAQLHVPHAFTVALQESGRVVQRSAEEEADIRVIAEGIDVAERGIPDAGGPMAVVEKLPNDGAAPAHPVEPGLDHASQAVIRNREPGVDAGFAPNGAREPQQLAHGTRLHPPGRRRSLADARSGSRHLSADAESRRMAGSSRIKHSRSASG